MDIAAGSTTGLLVNHTKRRYQAPSVPRISWKMGDAVKRLSENIVRDLTPRAIRGFRIEQAMQVDDEIPHMRVVDRLLRLRLPRHIGGGVIWIDAHDIEFAEILEFCSAKFNKLAAEDEVR